MIRRLGPAVLAVVLLAGCSSTDGEVDNDPPSGTNAGAEDTATDEPADEETSEEPAEESTEPAFGEAFTYDDGLTVTVSAPKPYKPSNSAAAGKGEAVAFDITLVNNTGATFDPSLLSASLQSGNGQAEEIFDTAKGLNGSPMTKLLDGREAKWIIGYTVQDPNDLVLEVSPDFERESILYVSQ